VLFTYLLTYLPTYLQVSTVELYETLQYKLYNAGASLADVLITHLSVSLLTINFLTDVDVSDYSEEFTIYPEEVEAYLSRLNAYKAAGPDEISTRFVKEHTAVLYEPVVALLNATIMEGFVLTIWKSAEVVPVPKIHPPRLIESDLRPISLLPVFAKTLEYFVRQWVPNKLEATFDPNRFGCLKNVQLLMRCYQFYTCGNQHLIEVTRSGPCL